MAIRPTIEYKGVDYILDVDKFELRKVAGRDDPKVFIDLTQINDDNLDEIAECVEARIEELTDAVDKMRDLSQLYTEPLLHERKNHQQSAGW